MGGVSRDLESKNERILSLCLTTCCLAESPGSKSSWPPARALDEEIEAAAAGSDDCCHVISKLLHAFGVFDLNMLSQMIMQWQRMSNE